MKRVWLAILFLAWGLTACSVQNQPSPVANNPTAVASPPTPMVISSTEGASTAASAATETPGSILGKGTVKGRILSSKTGKPIAGTTVWLAKIYGQGADAQYVVDGQNGPANITVANGTFTIANVAAVPYVIVVGDLYGKYVTVLEDSGKARIWDVQSGEVLDTKDINVDIGK